MSQADVVVENFRPGVLERLGLSAEVLERANPRLVHTSISNFGSSGPYRDYSPDRRGGLRPWVAGPIRWGSWIVRRSSRAEPFGQYVAGLYAAIGTLQAVRNRAALDAVQHVEVVDSGSLDRYPPCTILWLSRTPGLCVSAPVVSFISAFPTWPPCHVPTAMSGFMPVCPHQIFALLELVGRADLANDPPLSDADHPGRAMPRSCTTPCCPWLREQKKDDNLSRRPRPAAFRCGPIPSAKEVVEWVQLKERGHFS